MADSPANQSNLHESMPLRDDNPSEVDLLGFEDVVDLVEAIVIRKDLDPVTVGVNAPWGGGKTTVLKLLKARLDERSDVLCLLVSPWEYDGKTDPTTALIDEVLERLNRELSSRKNWGGKAKDLLDKLRRRVKLTKALKLAATAALTTTIPGVSQLIDLFDGDSSGKEDAVPEPTLQGFRVQFGEIMESEDLAPLERVVVLVDDLDRSLPDTVVETLEAIKLFLSVKRMAFVIAADEDNVAHAIGRRLSMTGQTINAHHYLEKIVQVPVRVPALSLAQTEEYLALLMLGDLPNLGDAIDCIKNTRPIECGKLKERLGKNLPHTRLADAELAERLAPLLHRQTTGNPRRLKRFLNAFWLRRSFGVLRNINLDDHVLAKLMLAELHDPDLFGSLLSWLSAGVVEERVAEIESGSGQYSEQVFEWGRLEPQLSSEDLSSYLLLAASLRGETLEEASLPKELRDIAGQLSDSSEVKRNVGLIAAKVLDDSKRASLVRFLAASLRQQKTPDRQKSIANSISGLATSTAIAATAVAELNRMDHGTIAAAVPLALLARNKPPEFEQLVRNWAESQEVAELTKKAAVEALGVK